MDNKLRCAVSGLRHGKDHCDAYRNNPDCKLVGLFDPNPDIANKRLDENPDAVVYNTYEDMLAQADLDIVSVSSPEFAHADQAVAALEAGCHVLLEKAMSDTLDGLKRIIAAVEKTGQYLYVGQEVRLTPAFLDARRLLQDNRLGTVYQAESCYIHNCEHLCIDGQWRGNPDLANHPMIGGGCHPVDLLISLLGGVKEVSAHDTHFNPAPTPYPDCISCLLTFDSGAVATVVVTVATRRPYELKLNLNGTAGYFKSDNSGRPSEVAFADSPEHAQEFIALETYEASHDCDSQIANLVSAIRNDTPLIVDAWEGANAIAVCLACIESAKTSQPVQPHRFIRPSNVQPIAEVLDATGWRTAKEILS